MHPFSLEKEKTNQVTGGNLIPKVTYGHSGIEAGDCIVPPPIKGIGDVVTMAIPEDGYDPRFPPIR
ncbi:MULTISPECIES: hypothetical protein [unclassified Pseudoalteromonas]|uniref:hypothetical protein n=1 Tax=unclassified Pseudoalteromonas TaxID=194690 RepID=UPI0005AA0ADD|nr:MULTISPECIES: hypothetical protein [unclassified Pseudoalteromonas]